MIVRSVTWRHDAWQYEGKVRASVTRRFPGSVAMLTFQDSWHGRDMAPPRSQTASPPACTYLISHASSAREF